MPSLSNQANGPPSLIQGEPLVDDDETLDGPGEGDDPLTAQRKWTRSLTRGQRELDAQAYDDAVVSFERAIAYNPSDAQSYGGLGAAQLGRGKWREAVRAYRKAVELSPFDAAFRAGLGRAYEKIGNPRLAAKAYGWAQKLDPTVSLK